MLLRAGLDDLDVCSGKGRLSLILVASPLSFTRHLARSHDASRQLLWYRRTRTTARFTVAIDGDVKYGEQDKR